MTLDRLRPLADRALGPWVAGARRLGLTPDGISLLALGVAVAAGFAFAAAGGDQRLYLAGALLVFLNGWLDLLDGALARELAVESPAGDLLDHVVDRYADIALVVGLAAGIDDWLLGVAAVTGVLMTSYLGTQAEAVGLERVYGGLVGRADRLALIGLAALLASVVEGTLEGYGPVGWLLVVLAVVGHLTALQRFVLSSRELR
jgi:archaetidylinositol phosphate synthase